MVSHQGTSGTPNGVAGPRLRDVWCPGARGSPSQAYQGLPTLIRADNIGPTSSAAGRAALGALAEHIPGAQLSNRDLQPLIQGENTGPVPPFPYFSAYKTGSWTAHDQGPEAGLTLQGRAQRGACPLRGRARIHFAAEQNGRVPFLPVRPKGRGIGGRAEHTEEQ